MNTPGAAAAIEAVSARSMPQSRIAFFILISWDAWGVWGCKGGRETKSPRCDASAHGSRHAATWRDPPHPYCVLQRHHYCDYRQVDVQDPVDCADAKRESQNDRSFPATAPLSS